MEEDIMLDTVNKKIVQLEAKQEVIRADIAKSDTLSDNIGKELIILEQANNFFSDQVNKKVSKIKGKIETLVNSGLSAIFEDSLKLVIESSVKYSKTTFKLQIENNGVLGMEETHGGGVLSVVAFILRIVITLLTDKRKFLVFDESLSMVSIGYQDRLSQFIRKLCDDLGFTVLLISHQPALSEYASIKYEVRKAGNQTKLKRIENVQKMD